MGCCGSADKESVERPRAEQKKAKAGRRVPDLADLVCPRLDAVEQEIKQLEFATGSDGLPEMAKCAKEPAASAAFRGLFRVCSQSRKVSDKFTFRSPHSI